LRHGFDRNPVSNNDVLDIFWLIFSIFSGGIKGIIVDNKVMMWACILDWILISMTNQDEAQSILESFYYPHFMDRFIPLLVPSVK